MLRFYMKTSFGTLIAHIHRSRFMAGRYELPEGTWLLIADLFERKKATGRPRQDDRLMLNGILWVLCSGACWRDMPERFGP